MVEKPGGNIAMPRGGFQQRHRLAADGLAAQAARRGEIDGVEWPH
jgi:hypothetical protein